MQDLRVTLVQADQIWENAEENYKNYRKLLSGVETDLILLPEMFQTCFSMNTNLSEPYTNSESINWLKDLSQELDAAIYTSLMIEEEGKFYNRGVFVEPNGSVSNYDKRKTFGLAGEDRHFTKGDSETIVNYKDWKFQLQICYDLRFPEIVRNRIADNEIAYDVILYVANWPEKRSEHWKALLKARAIENQCYVIGVNRVGTDANGFTYSGDSRCIDSLGKEENLQASSEELHTAVIKKTDLGKTREMLPFLKDR